MILPILISASVAPGSYLFCALAALARDAATSTASAADLAWLKTLIWLKAVGRIIVLPDVLAEAQAVSWSGRLRAAGSNAGAVCTIGVMLPAMPQLIFSPQTVRVRLGETSLRARTVK